MSSPKVDPVFLSVSGKEAGRYELCQPRATSYTYGLNSFPCCGRRSSQQKSQAEVHITLAPFQPLPCHLTAAVNNLGRPSCRTAGPHIVNGVCAIARSRGKLRWDTTRKEALTPLRFEPSCLIVAHIAWSRQPHTQNTGLRDRMVRNAGNPIS